jgi:DNA-binding Lrp family transcriptional regulator
MDELDSKILNIIQKEIPIEEHPYHKIAQKLNIEPEELLNRIKALKNSGYIRRIGAVFNSSQMGYKSLLVSAEVSESLIPEVVNKVNTFDAVTHNYYRISSLKSSTRDKNLNIRLNVWFTISTQSNVEKNDIINDISSLAGVNKLYEFPKLTLFKLKVFFEMGDSKCSMK